MQRDHDSSIPEGLIEALRGARSVVALTGAGVSAESGVPTFRDAQEGHWAKHRPEDLATYDAFRTNPEMVARWYDERRTKLAACEPNPGHEALAALERRLVGDGRAFTLITQNVDRLHQVAGSENVVELHGTLWEWRCVECGASREERGGAFEEHPPRCDCGGMRRPGVVWFGEMLPADALERAAEAVRDCDLFFSIGTSAVVYPAAGFAQEAAAGGARVAEINRDPTPLSGLVDWAVQGRSGDILPELVERLSDAG